MSRTNLLIALSLAAHAGGVIALEWVRVAESRAATAIEIAEVVKAPPKPVEPARVEPPPPPPKPERVQPVARRAEPAPAPAPVSEAPPKAVGMDALPSFGLSLSGGPSGTGLAVAAAPSMPAPAPVKRLAAPSAPKAPACSEAATRPRPISVPQPSYTVEARAAGVEGKVRVRLTVDETGQVVNVEVIEGLGHGLDDAALAAARAASFEPATQCGKPVRATFTISMRFAAS